MSTHKWCQQSIEFVIWILKTLLDQSLIILLPLPLFSGITCVAELVVKLILRLETLHVLIVCSKVLRFTLCNEFFPVFFSQIFVDIEGLHLVGPPSIRDDLYSYLLPFLLQLLRIFNVSLNRVFEEFALFIFGQVIESL
jgi:hypothetical protein